MNVKEIKIMTGIESARKVIEEGKFLVLFAERV